MTKCYRSLYQCSLHYLLLLMALSNNHSTQPADLLRCVQAPDGKLLVDWHGKLPSDKPLFLGAYPDVVRRALDHGLPEQWFNAHMVTEHFERHLRATLQTAIQETLAMLNKSGQCILGLEQVHAALDAGLSPIIVMAGDAGEAALKRLMVHPAVEHPPLRFATKEVLGKPFGRQGQVYVGLLPGKLTEKCAFFLRCNTRFAMDNAL